MESSLPPLGGIVYYHRQGMRFLEGSENQILKSNAVSWTPASRHCPGSQLCSAGGAALPGRS